MVTELLGSQRLLDLFQRVPLVSDDHAKQEIALFLRRAVSPGGTARPFRNHASTGRGPVDAVSFLPINGSAHNARRARSPAAVLLDQI